MIVLAIAAAALAVMLSAIAFIFVTAYSCYYATRYGRSCSSRPPYVEKAR
jgi:hypothetical protein